MCTAGVQAGQMKQPPRGWGGGHLLPLIYLCSTHETIHVRYERDSRSAVSISCNPVGSASSQCLYRFTLWVTSSPRSHEPPGEVLYTLDARLEARGDYWGLFDYTELNVSSFLLF